MQTFLPYPDFKASAECLDTKRLGKQRVEVLQILNALSSTTSKGWINHPATRMWRGYENLLIHYGQCMIFEWMDRGYKNTIKLPHPGPELGALVPSWLGNTAFHDSHKSNLLRKFPEYYSRYNWSVSNDLPYVWPS